MFAADPSFLRLYPTLSPCVRAWVALDPSVPFRLHGRDWVGLTVLRGLPFQQQPPNYDNVRRQPPLQFYLQAIQDANWDRVDVVTNAQDEESLNPVIPALQAKLSAGELPATVNIHTVSRSIIAHRTSRAWGLDVSGCLRNSVNPNTLFNEHSRNVLGSRLISA